MEKNYFLDPKDPAQKKYEALRAIFVDGLNPKEVARKFGYSIHTIYSYSHEFNKSRKIELFLPLRRGPKGFHSKNSSVKDKIISFRKKNFSISEIKEALEKEQILVSPPTIEKMLKKEGFIRLFRRTNAERFEALQSSTDYPEEADVSSFGIHKKMTTSFGGVFLFIPLILKLNLHQTLMETRFYGTKQIPKLNYLLSYLTLKLLGKERICHINDFSFDYGIGASVGLNDLPKSTAITQYSYRHPHSAVVSFLRSTVKRFYDAGCFKGKIINLDFHSIPHYGDESQLENNWIPTRNKSMKSVLALFAQDMESTYLCYSNGYIEKDKQNDAVFEFVNFFKKSMGKIPECLVFDSKLTTYEKLSELNQQGIKFITLRRRGSNFLKRVESIEEWTPITLDNVKRKYRHLKVSESKIKLKSYEGEVREIIVTGNGRELPMALITNDFESSLKGSVTIYSKRWRIENNIEENVDFFNLNALSSSVIVKVDFDIAITLIANSLYKLLASNFPLFANAKPKKIYRNFIEAKAKVILEPDKVRVKYEKKAYRPMIMDYAKQNNGIRVPWMENRKLIFEFEN